MSTLNEKTSTHPDSNPDPITGAPGAHPVGTGIGAAGAGATGAAIGAAVGGPVGAVVGLVAGSVAGGLAGKGVAESIDPTAHEAYWREHHAGQDFAAGTTYDEYGSAYRAGYQGFGTYGSGDHAPDYADVEDRVRADYEGTRQATEPVWEKAKAATRAAYEHARESVKRI